MEDRFEIKEKIYWIGIWNYLFDWFSVYLERKYCLYICIIYFNLYVSLFIYLIIKYLFI